MSYDQETIMAVWNKGKLILTHDSREWRRDDYGNVIRFSEYGDRQSDYGWEIHHVRPTVLGGGDEMGNLRPLHWKANASHGGHLGNR